MLVGILEGMPGGLSLIASRDIDPLLQERQKGYGRGRRQQIENDTARIVSGVRFGVTTGAPIALLIQNKDWKNWSEKMSVLPTDSQEEVRKVTIPRPGHADFAGAIKYNHEADIRNVLERASARETAMRTAIGAIAITLLRECGIEVLAYVRSIGSIEAQKEEYLTKIKAAIQQSQLRTYDAQIEQAMIREIDLAKEQGDTLGGVVECVVTGVPVGLGSHVQWDRKLDGLLAQALMSIQAVKGVEIGSGFTAARSKGSEVHDSFTLNDNSIDRQSNNAGGLEGGMTNGNPITVRVAMKPISTLMQPLNSIDLLTGEAVKAHIERSDVCAVPALSVIVEAVAGFTIAQSMLETFGGDTMSELKERLLVRHSKTSSIIQH